MKLILLKQILLPVKTQFILTILFLGLGIGVFAQEGTKKKKARISLEYINVNSANRQLKAVVKTKIDKSYQNVSNVKVKFYFDEAIEKNLLGVIQSDTKGIALLNLPKDIEKKMDSTFQYTFIAAIENDTHYRDKEKERIIKESKLEFKFVEEDSLRKVIVLFKALDSTATFIPVEDISTKLYVERMFGNLLISDDMEATDEDGMLSINFPSDIPGDKKGKLTVIAQIEDDDDYGTLMIKKTVEWGTPLIIDEKLNKRELWSARANTPIYLLVIINAMIVGIWGTIAYIILQINRIRTLGRNSA